MRFKLFVLLLVSALGGCASSDYIPYYLQGDHLDPNQHSEALVIARAAGIHGGLKDNEIHAEIAKMRSTTETSVDNTLALASSTTGLSMPAALVAGTAIAAITSDDSAQGNKFLAWMPHDLAPTPKEARVVFHDMILDAFEDAAQELSWEVGYIFRDGGFGSVISQAYVQDSDLECERRACRVKLVVRSPFEKPLSPPEFTGLNEGYLFSGRLNSAKLELDLKTEDPRIKLVFLQALSKRLPDWVYLYVGPDGTFYPYMLHQGELMYFESPQGATAEH